jgi:hypothetical protein
MNIDFSVAANVATAAIRNRITAIPICVAQDFSGLFKGIVVDHVEFDLPQITSVSSEVPILLADGNMADVAGHRVRLYIPMRIYLATEQQLWDGGKAGPQNPIVIDLDIWFDMIGELQMDNGNVIGAGIRIVYVRKNPEFPDPSLDAQVEALLTGAGQFIPLDVEPIENVLKKHIPIRNVGVATPVGEGSIVIRIEVESMGSDPVSDWQNFFSSPPRFLDTRQWAVLIDGNLLTTMAEAKFGEGLAKSSQIEVLEEPSALWLGFTGAPFMKMKAYVDVIEACTNGLDIAADLTTYIMMQLVTAPEGKQIHLDFVASWDLIDSDVLLCGITMGIAGATLGAVLGGAGGPIGAAIGAIIGMVLTIANVVAIASTYEPDPSAFQQKDCETVESDEDHVLLKCLWPLNLGSSELIGRLDPDELLGHPNGLLLRGSSQVETLQKKLIVSLTPLGWEFRGHCGSFSTERIHTGGVGLSGFPWQAGNLEVCHSEIVDDRLAVNGQPGYFMIERIYGDKGSIFLKINTNDALQDAYTAYPPYPCHIMVRTSHGARFLDLGVQPSPPPQLPTDPQLLHELKLKMLNNCFDAIDKFWNAGRYNPKWTIDPPPDKESAQHWEVTVVGLEPGDALELLDSGGHVLASVPARTGGVARAQAVVTLPEGQLSIARKTSAETATPINLDPNVHRLAITQRLLVLECRVTLSSIAREIVSFRGVGRYQLAVLTESGIHVWDPSSIGTIRATSHLLLDDDISHICGLDRGIVALGASGMLYLEARDDGRLRLARRLALPEVSDMTVVGRSLIALARDSLLILDPQLKVRAKIPVEGAVGVGTIAGRLAVSLEQGERIRIYEVAADQHQLHAGPTTNAPAGARLVSKGLRLSLPMRSIAVNHETALTPGEAHPIAARVSPGLRIVGRRARSGTWPELVTERTTWLDEAVRLGSLLAHVEGDGRQLAIYRFAQTVSV